MLAYVLTVILAVPQVSVFDNCIWIDLYRGLLSEDVSFCVLGTGGIYEVLKIEVSKEASRCSGSCRIGRQVVKLCAVYGIAPGLSIQQSRGSDRAWVWTACDLQSGQGK